MRGIVDFAGALLFILTIPAVGAGVAAVLWKLTPTGLTDYLWPVIALAAIVASYYYGKAAHRVLARVV